MLIDRNSLGSRVIGEELRFDLLLPHITPDKSYRLFVDIIHEKDQFTPSVPASSAELSWLGGDLGHWQLVVDMADLPWHGHMGEPGRYFYRYRITHLEHTVVPWFTDPFAQASGPGTLSAFDYPPAESYEWSDGDFRVPPVTDLMIYELMVDEFAENFAGIRSRLDYLAGLGINCIELMPVTNVREPFRWGYMPLSYFAIEERYGGKAALQALIDEAHGRGIAVIHDAVYAHAHGDFCYHRVYRLTGEENPMMGFFVADMFGGGANFARPFTREFFAAVNDYFLQDLHFDGFRYDYVPGYYDGPVGVGYAKLVYDTYWKSLEQPRFRADGKSRVIQIAEHLQMPKRILHETFTSGSKRWGPMLEAQSLVSQPGKVSERMVHQLLLIDFSEPWPARRADADPNATFPVTTLQFLETHDKSRLMYFVSGGFVGDSSGFDLIDRSRHDWYRLQPFAIALMTCEGVPMLWQGQEFGEIYGLPDQGDIRVLAARPLHWDYFYEPGGRQLVRLYRRLGRLRAGHQALRSRSSYYYYRESDPDRGLVAYHRAPDDPAQSWVMVFINFGAYTGSIELKFPLAGRWREQLNQFDQPDLAELIKVADTAAEVSVQVPSHYGKLFVLEV